MINQSKVDNLKQKQFEWLQMRDLKRQIQQEKSKFAKNKLSRTAMGYDLKVGEQMKETQELRNMVKQLEKQETLIINRLNQTI